MQPYSTQNQTFRYFDSKRPLVVSFRRVNKVTLPNDPINSAERCSSICDIHRLDLSNVDNNKMLPKSKYSRRPPFPANSQSCRNFNVIENWQKSNFNGNLKERTPITYPKEKFHGNAKLLLNANERNLRNQSTLMANLYWLNTSKTLSQNGRSPPEEIGVRKSTSTPTLAKLQSFPNAFDSDERGRKRSFVSVLNVKFKENC